MSELYSIIICTRNRSRVLERVLNHHVQFDRCNEISREYIIVDNASTDDTREVVVSFSQKVDCAVHYVLEQRAGHSIALNTGCRCSNGTKLVFTDDDTLPASDWLRSIDETFQRENADWVFGPVVPKWEFGPQPSWYGSTTSRFIACLHLGNQILVGDELSSAFAGANHACDRSKLFGLGLYDENLGLRGDGLSYRGNDDHLFERARLARLKVVYTPRASVDHLIAKTRYDRSTHRKTFRNTGRNEFLQMVREPPPGNLWFGVPRYYFGYIPVNCFRYLAATVSGNKPLAFYYETRIIRFWSLISAAVRHCWGSSRQKAESTNT